MTPAPPVRPYRAADRSACLAAFDSNCPAFFTRSERELFSRFLDEKALDPARPFYVAEQDGRAVGCGGHRVSDYGVAYLAWGMVERSRHRAGIGTALLAHRLETIRDVPHAWCVVMDTSPASMPFYARFGFAPFRTVPDGYRTGLDQVFLRLVWATPTPAR